MSFANKLIEKFNMMPHPEGGYFTEIHRSKIIINDCSNPKLNNHSVGTSIYYLLQNGETSKFHYIEQEEIWHFYSGGTILLHLINTIGEYDLVRLGADLEQDTFQYTVPAHCLMAAEILGEYCLVGCTVSPGFEFADFTMPTKKELTQKYPLHKILFDN